MRTRRGTSYPMVNNVTGRKRTDRSAAGAQMTNSRKKLKLSFTAPAADVAGGFDLFDKLPNDIVLSILQRVGSEATSPAGFLAVSATCKRLNGLGLDSFVLSRASAETFAVKAKKWSESARRFLKRSSDAGNADASYTLGMIQFYCFQNWSSGASLMAKAALDYHAPALYSLAVIQFNGSGGAKKDLRTGVSLCARAAYLGHIDALRELGHCLQDGYGVRQNIPKGRQILVQANGRELDVVLSKNPSAVKSGEWLKWNPLNLHRGENAMVIGCPLLSDFGWNVPPLESHPANRFLAEWFADRIPSPAIRMCSHGGCGRPETRIHEFRRCSVCGDVNYCSRACQALDWKFRHRMECRPRFRFMNVNPGGDNVNLDRGNAMVANR